MNGILLVDKPPGITSHDAVDYIREKTAMRRIGHTGTLDPAATGLLVLCLGHATRLSEHLTGLDKTYEGAMRLGIITDSYDLDGTIQETHSVPPLEIETIHEACATFTGQLMQVPPMVSAVKVGGERLYKRARKGQVVERPPRPVTIHEFEAIAYTPPDVQIRVKCTRGTYVRSLCHEVGQHLGCGAVLASLRRTYVGHFAVADALALHKFKNRHDVESRLLPIDNALDLPQVILRQQRRATVLAGGSLGANDLIEPCPVDKGWVQIKTPAGQLLALGQLTASPTGPRIHPKRVFGK